MIRMNIVDDSVCEDDSHTCGIPSQVLVKAVLECVHCSAAYYVTLQGIPSGCYLDGVEILSY